MQIFEYGLDSPQLGTLLFSAVAAFIYLFMVARPPSARRTGVKTLSVALLGVLSVVVDGPVLLTAALLACAAGDAFLAQDDRAFLAGLAAFLAGHVLYVIVFVSRGDIGLATQPLRLVIAAVMILSTVMIALRLLPAVGDLKLPVAAYILVILSMGLAALSTPGWGVVGGAVLFMASDTVLAAQKFLLPQEDAPHPRALFVWISYYLAQLLIALSVLGLA
ncbi:lysoplasmalogenase [Hoeflea sp. TYP-13]|uniref:lysoplasmalogenase n=1 Tax=Hoeflea sp. TYP-13 TaxID=3230023 RepID=UPI0034C63DBE